MNNWSVPLGYDPRCTIYPKKTIKGMVYYYLRYYLPGGKRVSRSVGRQKKEARRMMFDKEQRLRLGVFDDFDLRRIPESIKSDLRKPSILLEDALERYMKATRYNRRPRTNRETYGVLRNLIGKLESEFIDEVTTEKVQGLAGMLQSQGLSQATVLSYLSLLKTFFNWLIEDAEVLDGRNPVNKVRKPPRSSKVRDYLVDPEVIKKLLSQDGLKCRKGVPIIPLTRFLVTTGARLGEVLHAEWQDFDLDQGVWKIFPKPQCPTYHGMGWYPKWKKPRMIELLPQARMILESLPRPGETWGNVLEEGGIQWKKAHFVFTVKRKVEIGGEVKKREVRISSVKRAWGNLLDEADIRPIQIKDLRTFFNWLLVSQYGLSNKEAGAYLGNSEAVNQEHYTPVSLKAVSSKLRTSGDCGILPQLAE